MAASTWVDPAGTERRSPAAASYIASPLTSFSLPLPRASLLTTPFFLFFPFVPPVLFFSSSKDTSERARQPTDASRPSLLPFCSLRSTRECRYQLASWSSLVVGVVCYGPERRGTTRGRQRRLLYGDVGALANETSFSG
ncbi:hypothetical protein MTO96_001916 [Rhipicephalus appendiculatus]